MARQPSSGCRGSAKPPSGAPPRPATTARSVPSIATFARSRYMPSRCASAAARSALTSIKHVVAVGHEEEVEEILPLRREERGIDRALIEPAHVVGDEPLQKVARLRAGYPEDAAVGWR